MASLQLSRIPASRGVTSGKTGPDPTGTPGGAINRSIGGCQYGLHLCVIHRVFPEPVILIEADIREGVWTGETEIAESVQADRDPQRVRRQVAFELVLADHMERRIPGRCYVKRAIIEREEIPNRVNTGLITVTNIK